ncbi:hypothetical protein Tco_1189400 [Tanacetum coccineum]
MSSTGFRDSLDEKSKANLVQIKGRFSMTSEDLDILKDIPLSTIPRRSLKPAPREINTTSQNGKLPPLPRSAENNGSKPDNDLLFKIYNAWRKSNGLTLDTKVSELQSRLRSLSEELTTEKSKYVQLLVYAMRSMSVYTGKPLLEENGTSIKIALVDAITGQIFKPDIILAG